MSRKLRKASSTLTEENDTREYNQDDDGVTMHISRKSTLSVKDSVIIILLSTLFSVSVIAGTFGIEGFRKKIFHEDLADVAITVFLLIFLFSFITYLLVKFAAHYLVYLAISTFFGIVFPVSRKRQRRAIQEIYEKAEKRE